MTSKRIHTDELYEETNSRNLGYEKLNKSNKAQTKA
jgi:hypothetical protein